MAKKKNRSTNVARKREKRNRNRKSKQKRLASEKHRKFNYNNLDEEDLFDLLMHSQELTSEPEFENVHFDYELTYNEIKNFVQVDKDATSINLENEPDIDLSDVGVESEDVEDFKIFQGIEDTEEICEKLREEVFAKLITPELIKSVKRALSSCETRFRRVGDRTRADAALVSVAFFEAVPSDKYSEHPIFDGIIYNTLGYITKNPLEVFKENLGANIDHTDFIETQKPVFSEVPSSGELLEAYKDEEQGESDSSSFFKMLSSSKDPTLTSTDTHPFTALYKNCIGIDLIDLLHRFETHTDENNIVENNENTIMDLDLNITVSEDRLHIFAQNDEDLKFAMELFEKECDSAIIFLAKTIDEGGNTDGTE